MISPTLVTASAMEESDDTNTPYHTPKKFNQCKICDESFGKIINRAIICFKCNNSFCSTHCTQQRWNFTKNTLSLVCNECIDNEHTIHFKQRLKNLKIKHYPDGTYINKVPHNSFEYQIYNLRKKTKIISINSKNVECFDAQTIANTLNTITIPFDITFDTTKCICMNNKNKNNTENSAESYETPKVKRRHSVETTIGFGTPLSDKSMQRIFNHITNQDELVTADHGSSPSSSTSKSNHNPSFDIKISPSLSPNPERIIIRDHENGSRDERNENNEELKRDLRGLYERMNAFNNKYNNNKLDMILNDLNGYNEIEYELDRINDENNIFIQRLNKMNEYKIKQKLNFNNCKEIWNTNDIIEWIITLENKRFKKYENKLKNGFIKMNIMNGFDLCNITQSCLNGNIFKINHINDCKHLIKFFNDCYHRHLIIKTYNNNQGYRNGNKINQSIQSQINDKNWFGINPVKSMVNVCSMFIEGK